MPNRAAVSLVVPTYNGRQTLAENVSAMEKALESPDEVVIIDDASSDDTLSWLTDRYNLRLLTNVTTNHDLTADDVAGAEYWQGETAHHLPVLVIVNKRNLRFGASVNRAVRAVHSPYILLLNNDVAPAPEVVSKLLPHFADVNLFAVGCHESEAHHDSHSAGKNKLWFERGMFRHSRADDFESGETAWVSGGSGLFDRNKWLVLGGFDPLFYPAYWEDIDLSMRARLRGWRVWFAADAAVIHRHETTNQSAFGQRQIARMSWKNARAFTWRHAHGSQWWQVLFWTPYNYYHWWRSTR